MPRLFSLISSGLQISSIILFIVMLVISVTFFFLYTVVRRVLAGSTCPTLMYVMALLKSVLRMGIGVNSIRIGREILMATLKELVTPLSFIYENDFKLPFWLYWKFSLLLYLLLVLCSQCYVELEFAVRRSRFQNSEFLLVTNLDMLYKFPVWLYPLLAFGFVLGGLILYVIIFFSDDYWECVFTTLVV